jgi:hypothetical protein
VLLTSPGLPEDEDYLRDLGGSEVLDRDADVAALVHERYPDSIEALLDLVSYAPEGFDTHAEVLKDDGRGPRRSPQPAKDRSTTTSWRCQRRTT